MAPDLMTLGAICHEESAYRRKASNSQLQPKLASSTTPPIQVTVSEIRPDSPDLNEMATSGEARTRSLVNMYSTGFVFNQNQKYLVKNLPWSGSKHPAAAAATVNHNPVPTSSDMQKMVDQLVQGRGKGRKEAFDKQVQGLQDDKVRSDHATSMFALLS